MSVATFASGDDDRALLETMGLNEEILREVLRRGLAQFNLATDDHPTNGAGLLLYLGLVQSLRELLRPAGWERNNAELALTVNEPLQIAIAVRSGDANTGISRRTPSFKYAEGATTQEAIDRNARQLSMFDGIPAFAEYATPTNVEHVTVDKYQTWWLLHYVDEERGEIRAELSLPIGTGETAQWRRRIVLKPVPFDSAPFEVHYGTASPTTEIDVPVRKKT